MPLNNLESTIKSIVQFRDDRHWEQFHNSKDLALAIAIEASELNELFLWKENEEVNMEKLKGELADVFIFSILLAHKHGFDISSIILEKLDQNAIKYPVDKAKGTAKKYNEL